MDPGPQDFGPGDRLGVPAFLRPGLRRCRDGPRRGDAEGFQLRPGHPARQHRDANGGHARPTTASRRSARRALRWPRPAMPFRCTRTGRTTTVSTPPSRRPRRDRSRSTSRTSHRVTGSTSGQRRQGSVVPALRPNRGQEPRARRLRDRIAADGRAGPRRGDEGWVEPATTQSASSGGARTRPCYLPEYLMRWAGWSLVGARPGKHLSDVPSDGLEPDAGRTRPAATFSSRSTTRRRPARCRRCVSGAPTVSGHGPSTSPATASRSPRPARLPGPRRR